MPLLLILEPVSAGPAVSIAAVHSGTHIVGPVLTVLWAYAIMVGVL